MDSILGTIKKMLGIDTAYTAFDIELITFINAQFPHLYQLGVGDGSFLITGDTETWFDYLGNDEVKLQNVKSFIYAKVRLVFDPPSSSFATTALNELVSEAEFRLSVASDEINNTDAGSSV